MITILIELRERLQTACIAGCQILIEDQRFLSIVQKITGWKESSPVFAKLCELCEPLTTTSCEHMQEQVLDLLSFLDALLCTQAQSLEEVSTQPFTTKETKSYHQFKYSELKPIMQALETSGSGRYEVIDTAWKEQPAIFQDYRILPVLVRDLQDSYAELASLVQTIIQSIGDIALPYVKDQFNPSGGKEMVRRAQLIVDIGKEKESACYVNAFASATADIKKELVRGLSYCADQVEFLRSLAKTERGKVKEEVYYALGMQQDEQVTSFFLEKLKKQESVVPYLLHQKDQALVQELCATIKTMLSKIIQEQRVELSSKEATLLEDFAYILAYKEQQDVYDLVEWALAHHEQFSLLRRDKELFRIPKQGPAVPPLAYCTSGRVIKEHTKSFDQALLDTLLTTYVDQRSEEVKKVILSLYRSYPTLCKEVYAHTMMIDDAMHAFDVLQQDVLVEDPQSFYAELFAYIAYDSKRKQVVYLRNQATNPHEDHQAYIPLAGLDLRWIPILTQKQEKKGFLAKLSGKLHQVPEHPVVSSDFLQLINLDHPQLLEMLTEYFETYEISAYTLHFYHRCHKDMQEYLPRYYKKNQKDLSYYAISSMAHKLSRNRADRIETLKRCKKIQASSPGKHETYFQECIDAEIQRLTLEEDAHE